MESSIILPVGWTPKKYSKMIVLLGIFALLAPYVAADTPANCSYDDIAGDWVFSVSGGGGDNTIDCSNPGEILNNE